VHWISEVEGSWILQLPARMYTHTVTAVIVSRRTKCLLLAKVTLWLLLPTFLWNYQQDEWRWYYEKNAGWRCRRTVSVKHLPAVAAAKRGFVVLVYFNQDEWLCGEKQNVLLCELTSARLQGSPWPEHNWYVSWNKLPDFMTYITQRIKFFLHSSV